MCEKQKAHPLKSWKVLLIDVLQVHDIKGHVHTWSNRWNQRIYGFDDMKFGYYVTSTLRPIFSKVDFDVFQSLVKLIFTEIFVIGSTNLAHNLIKVCRMQLWNYFYQFQSGKHGYGGKCEKQRHYWSKFYYPDHSKSYLEKKIFNFNFTAA